MKLFFGALGRVVHFSLGGICFPVRFKLNAHTMYGSTVTLGTKSGVLFSSLGFPGLGESDRPLHRCPDSTLNTHTKWDVPGENLVTPEIQGAG